MVAFGGEGHDRINGSQRPDDLMGGAGDDYLIGYAGNDTIVGGPGDDILTGSPDVAESFVIDRAYGNDTYVFEAGDGSDFLLDPNGANHLQFAAGISTDNVTVRYVAGPERAPWQAPSYPTSQRRSRSVRSTPGVDCHGQTEPRRARSQPSTWRMTSGGRQ